MSVTPLAFLPLDETTFDRIEPHTAAYALPDYAGPKGRGRACAIADGDRPVGVVWTDDDTAAGILPVTGMDAVENAVAGLILREYRNEGVSASEAFDRIVTMWDAGAVFGDVDLVELATPDPDDE